MNYHYHESLIVAEDLTNKIDMIIKENYDRGHEAGKSDLMDVLDEIRAEIEKLDYVSIEDGSDGYDYYVDKYDVLGIIDKYKEGEEE